MELVMWIVLGTVAALGVLALIPVLVIGGWFVIIFVIFKIVDEAVDAAIGFLDQGWRTIRAGLNRSKGTPCPGPEEVSVGESQPIPVLTAP